MFNAQNKTREWQIWGFYFELLKGFFQRERHCNVPMGYEEKGVQLGKWVERQRAYGPTLTDEQRAALESLNGWRWKQRTQLPRMQFQGSLPLFPVAPIKDRKPAPVKRRRTIVSVDDSNCIVQRNVDNPGESIVIKTDDSSSVGENGGWQSQYRLLLKFMNREGHCRVPASHMECGVKLGVWIANQKQIYRSQKMKPARQEKLASLPGWVWSRLKQRSGQGAGSRTSRGNEQKWDSHYQRLLQFGKREGHYLVPSRHIEDGFRLGVWVARHRARRWTISPNHRQRLESLAGWTWDGQDGKWQRRFELLQQFVSREGHARVGKGHLEDGMKLGVWVMHQHDSFRRGELGRARATQLETMPGWEWNGQPEDLSSLDVDNLIQDIWSALFGLGALPVDHACLEAVRSLHQAGISKARSAREGSPIRELIEKCLARGIELGIIDCPGEGFFRAVLTDQECYEAEDWDKCIQAILGDTSKETSALIAEAAAWAREMLGLDFDKLRPGDSLGQYLGDALERVAAK